MLLVKCRHRCVVDAIKMNVVAVLLVGQARALLLLQWHVLSCCYRYSRATFDFLLSRLSVPQFDSQFCSFPLSTRTFNVT